MARVTIHCQSFNGAYASLNGAHEMDVSLPRYLAASVTLGFQRFRDVLQAGPRLWMHRLGLGFSGVSFLTEEHGRIFLTEDHVGLDGSEKAAMSYWQGMVFAKLAAEKVLNIPWLAHADALEKSGALKRKAKTDQRADMAGRDHHGLWHVIESKGYSSHPGLRAIRNAKDQAAVVETINSSSPETTSACVARLWRTPIDVLLDDPKPQSGEKWNIDDGTFWEHYYGGVRDYIAAEERRSDFPSHPNYVFASLTPLLGFLPLTRRGGRWETPFIGVHEKILINLSAAAEIMPRILSAQPMDGAGMDGIVFVGGPANWNEI
jgi:hypothetical protein